MDVFNIFPAFFFELLFCLFKVINSLITNANYSINEQAPLALQQTHGRFPVSLHPQLAVDAERSFGIFSERGRYGGWKIVWQWMVYATVYDKKKTEKLSECRSLSI